MILFSFSVSLWINLDKSTLLESSVSSKFLRILLSLYQKWSVSKLLMPWQDFCTTLPKPQPLNPSFSNPPSNRGPPKPRPVALESKCKDPSCAPGGFMIPMDQNWFQILKCLKWWYPQITHFNRVFHCKPSILGYHHLRKHPCVCRIPKRCALRSKDNCGPTYISMWSWTTRNEAWKHGKHKAIKG